MPLFAAAVLSSTGPRPDNQDSAVAGPGLVAVADGVGGNVGGAVASSLVASWLAPLDCAPPGTPVGGAALRLAVDGANRRIADTVALRPRLRTMATTLVAVLADGDGFTLAWIGDSRVYLLQGGRLTQVTRDQTLVQALVDGGDLTEAEAAVHPQRSVVYAALHGDPGDSAALQVHRLDARPGDRLLLCSDGLSDVLPAQQLAELLAAPEPPAAVARTLVSAALSARTPDNTTVVVADVLPDGDPAAPPRRAAAVTAGAAAHPPPEVSEALEALWPG